MKKSLFFALLVIFSINSFSQVAQFGLKKAGKSKILDATANIEFIIDISGDSLDDGSISYIGEVESLSKDKLKLYPESYRKEGYGDVYSFSYSKQFYDIQGDLVEIDPMTISSIYYQGNAANTVNVISATLTALGYTTALLVAPLVSINYKTGDFNSDRYYKVAGAGLIAVGVSLPLAILTSGRTFELKDLFVNDEFDEGWVFDYDLIETY